MKIVRNKNHLTWWQNVLFGLTCIIDGLVTVLSLGQYTSSLSFTTIGKFTLTQLRKKIDKKK